jgi:hypothetical protein
MPNKAPHWTGIPLRSIPASELGRYPAECLSLEMNAISTTPNAPPPQVSLHTFIRRLCAALVLCFAGCSSGAEERETFTISSPRTFGLRNLTVVRIDPNGQTVRVDWKGCNTKTGDAFNVPFEEVRFSSGAETYLVSDESAGNNELTVNSKQYKFDSQNQQLLIQFGSGVSIEAGGDYEQAEKMYDLDD